MIHNLNGIDIGTVWLGLCTAEKMKNTAFALLLIQYLTVANTAFTLTTDMVTPYSHLQVNPAETNPGYQT